MLSDFYWSNAWVAFTKMLRLERTNADGTIKCEYCGKPIVRKYDCIAHHVIHLTEENYLDASIALNPDNVQLVHHKCHNRIHDRLGIYQRKVYLVHGSPFSGKSAFVAESMSRGDLIVDVDRIWHCVSGCDMYDKPDRLKGEVFRVRDLLIDDVARRDGHWKCAYVVGGYPLSVERERVIRRLGAEEVHIDTSRDECLSRLERCDDGRDTEQWERYIADYWEMYC